MSKPNRALQTAAVACYFTAVAFAVVTTGCTTDPPMGRSDPLVADLYPEIVVLDNLRKYLIFSQPVVDTGPPLRVSITTRSIKTKKRLSIQYRFIYMDDDNRDVSTNSDWRYAELEPRIRVSLSGTAIDDRATRWNLEVRPAR